MKNPGSPEAVIAGTSQSLPFQSTVMGGSEEWLRGKGLSHFRARTFCLLQKQRASPDPEFPKVIVLDCDHHEALVSGGSLLQDI